MEAPDRTDSGPMDVIRLTRNRSARLDAPLLLRALDGTLWVTVDGQPDDWVLEPGDSRRIERGRVMVFALGGAARLAVRDEVRDEVRGAMGSTVRRRAAAMLERLRGGWARLHAALSPLAAGTAPGRAARRTAP